MSLTEALTLVGLVVTLGVAIVGWHRGNRADQHATEALELARSAEARADRLERLTVERRDVTWVREEIRGEAGWVVFTNAGSDPAYEVSLLVDPDGHARRTVSRDVVHPTERIELQMADLALEAQRRFQQMLDHNVISNSSVPCRARITWRSESGVEESADFAGLRV